MVILLNCVKCRKQLRVPSGAAGRKAKCPMCGATLSVPSAVAEPSKPEQSVPTPTINTCPECHEELPKGAALCVNCGLDLRTGEPLKSVERRTEPEEALTTAMSTWKRRLFLAAKSVLGIAALVGALVGCVAFVTYALVWLPEKKSSQAVAYWIEVLQGDKEVARRQAAVELARLGPKAVQPLIAALKDERPQVRFLAATALGWIGPPAKAAVPSLKDALQDKNQFEAPLILVEIGRSELSPALSPTAVHVTCVKQAAIVALRRINLDIFEDTDDQVAVEMRRAAAIAPK